MTYDDGAVIYSQCRQFDGVLNRVDETFQGTKGRAHLTSYKPVALWDAKGQQIYRNDGKGEPDPYQQEHVELFAAVAKGEYTFADAENAARSTLTGIMGRMACYTGKIITLDEAMKSTLDLAPDRLAFDATPKSLPGPDGEYPSPVPGINPERYI